MVEINGSWCMLVDTEFVAMQPRPNGDHIVFRSIEVHDSLVFMVDPSYRAIEEPAGQPLVRLGPEESPDSVGQSAR